MLKSAGSAPSFYRNLAILEGLAAAPALSAHQFAKTLTNIYERVAFADFAEYDMQEVTKVAPELMYRLFDVRMALRNRIGEIENKGFMSAEVEQGFRNCFRVLRYVTDMLGEMHINFAEEHAGTEELRGLTGRDYNTLLNAAFAREQNLTFRSGDVLVVRGERHNSAAIARIGDTDSQFSHAAIVYIDDDGGHWVVESLIEEGAIINTLVHELDHGIARAVLYRHKDAALASRAARMIHDRVAESRRFFKRRIWYDFSMRLDDRRQLFCSKLIRLAFQLASDGKTVLPRYPTRIGMQNRDFIDRIGVKTDLTFAPADMDMDKDFDLVCEWQDYRETSHIRLQDFAMDKLFEWMDTYNYRFEETMIIRIASLLGRLSSYFSETAQEILSSVAPKVPPNMRRRTIAAVAMLHRTAEPLARELQTLERNCITRFGRPMHGQEIFEHLEDIRRRQGDRIGYLVRR